MTDAVDERGQPSSLESERAVLGAILLHEELYDHAAAILKPADFYRAAHRLVFEAMIALREKHAAIDFLTVREHLTTAGDINAVGAAYLSGMTDGIPRSTNVEEYAKVVKDKAVRRALIVQAGKAIEAAQSSTDSVVEVIGEAQQSLYALAEDGRTQGFTTMSELVTQGMAQIDSLIKHKGTVPGVPTGFPELDALTLGLHPGNLIVVAGRPGSGKTSFATNIVEHVGASGRTAAMFSLEMDKGELFFRMLSGRARVDGQRIKSGRLWESDWPKLSEAIGVLGTSNILIDDTASIGLTEIGARCRRLASEDGLDLVAIDYLQLMKGTGQRFGNRTEEVSQITRGAKVLAKDLGVPVILLSQLSRAPETRKDHRPILSDLRDSGSIEQDADVVIFVYRDEMYRDGDADSFDQARSDGVAELIIAKQRSGPLDTIKVAYLKPYTRFESIAAA